MLIFMLMLSLMLTTRPALGGPPASDSLLSYELSSEELQAFIDLKKSIDPSYRPFRPQSTGRATDNTTVAQSKRDVLTDPYHHPNKRYAHRGSTAADCAYHNGIQEIRKVYTFNVLEAECEIAGFSPDYAVNCTSRYTISQSHLYNPSWRGDIWEFTHVCPEHTVCVDVELSSNTLERERKDVVCQPEEKVESPRHSAVAVKGARSSASSEPDWCSLDVLVPGLDYPSTSAMTTFVLSEEVLWADGRYYNAPKLWIRDSPKKYARGFDRGFRTNTNMISTELNVGSSRGKLQSRAVNFCMEMIRGGNVWTIMMYTYFRYDKRSHRLIPKGLDNVPDLSDTDDDNITK